MAAYDHLIVEDLQEGVVQVCLNRPDARNALNEQLINELTEVFEKVPAKKNTRLLLLRGKGEVFCAGGDLNWMRQSLKLSFEENLQDTMVLARMFEKINQCAVPTIGIVHGAAFGGGLGLVAGCDVVLAEQETLFSFSETRLGLVPATIAPFVVEKIGVSAARRFLLTAERFGAPIAQSIGLVHEVVKGEKGLQSKMQEFCKQMLTTGPQATRLTKKHLLDLATPEKRKQIKDPIAHSAELLARARVSPEAQEGIKAFLEKGSPSWVGPSR